MLRNRASRDLGIRGGHPGFERGAASVFEETRQHVAKVVLTPNEDGDDADRPTRLVRDEPVDRTFDGYVPQSGPDVVMALAPVRRRQDALRGDTDRPSSRPGVLDRAFEALAEV